MHHLVSVLPDPPTAADLADLRALLRDVVEGGASVGFMFPVQEPDLAGFWQAMVDEARAGARLVLVARVAGRIVGSVQLEFAARPNSSHRAEVQKLLVFRAHRGRGIGCALMTAAEAAARARGRTLLVLDTSASGNALGLYARCGYTTAGVIPRYARNPDGPLIDTMILYKHLTPDGSAPPPP